MGMKKKGASEDYIRGNNWEEDATEARIEENGQAAMQWGLRKTQQDRLAFLTQTWPWITLYLPEKNLLDTPCCAQSKPGKLGKTQMYSYFKAQHLGL